MQRRRREEKEGRETTVKEREKRLTT